MASDVIFDSHKGFEDMDSNIFMNDGVMDPKELYLTDLACSKDASSSDSGISTLDDLPDIANETDLQSLIDADFKDLDFNFEHTLSKGEPWGCDSELIVGLEAIKTEPLSPQTTMMSDPDDLRFADTLSPDFYTLAEDISRGNDGGYAYDGDHVYLPVKAEGPEDHLQQPVFFQDFSSSSSPDQLLLNHSPVYSPQSTTDFSSQSSSPSSPKILSPHTPQTIAVTLSPGHRMASQVTSASTATSPPLKFTVLPSPPAASQQQSSILVLPHVKKEVLTVCPSPPPPIQPAVTAVTLAMPAAAVDLSAILSSKVKIQPKPGRDKVVPMGNGSTWLPNAANQGSLPPQSIAVGGLVTSSPLMTHSTITSYTDVKSLKRAQRIIKNRESASLSRKRKKEYMSSLEERLQACVDENSRLFQENECLKKQVVCLKQENLQLKVPNGLSPAKRVCLMCVGLLLVLNLSPFSWTSIPSSGPNSDPFNLPTQHMGRQLLSVPSNDQPVRSESAGFLSRRDRRSWSQADDELSRVIDKMNISAKIANMCPMYFNSTESLRLAEQLTGWMIRQEEEKKKKEEKKKQRRKKVYPTLKRFGSSHNIPTGSEPRQNGRYLSSLAGPNYPLQVFNNGPDPRQQMLNAIHRRNDTFYILSFSTDYFLVPATAHNKTMRPRMSLLMPVFTPSLNESTGQSQDSVAMMQIDCEISNTQLIHVQRSDLPKDATLNATAKDDLFPHGANFGQGQEEGRGGNDRNSSGSQRGDGHLREQRKYWQNLRRKKSFT